MKKLTAVLTILVAAMLVLVWLFRMPAAPDAPPDDAMPSGDGTPTAEQPSDTSPPEDDDESEPVELPPPTVDLPDTSPSADRGPASDASEDDEEGSILASVDRVLGSLEEANAAFDTPEAMRWGETRSMTLALSPSVAAEDLARRLDDPTESETAQVRVAPRMRATLSGTGFDIRPITAELQAVSLRDVTEWKWDVEPTRTGRQRLHLSLSALIDVEGETTSRSIRTFSREIEVDVTMTQLVATFMSEHWKWLWAALLVPLASWGWTWMKARRQGSKEPTR